MNNKIIFGIILILIILLIIFVFYLSKPKLEKSLTSNVDNSTVITYKLSPSKFQDELNKNDSILIDFRTPEEFNSGYIDRSQNIDILSPSFMAELVKLDKNSKYLIYCNSGNRSSQALKIMKSNGFVDVMELEGGIVAWKQSGLPIVNQ